jgi:hypothetical protein
MIERTHQKTIVQETAEAVESFVTGPVSTSLKRGVNERRIFTVTPTFLSANSAGLADRNVGVTKNLPRVFFEEKPRGELRKTKPTKENRKDAHAAIKS